MVSHHLLFGKENFLKEEFIRSLKSRLFPGGQGADFNFQQFNFEQHSPVQMLDFLRTSPFLTEKRLAICEGLEELDGDDKKQLLAQLPGLPQTAVCVFLSEATNVKKDGFLTELALSCQTTACHVPFDRDLPGWVEARAKKHSAQVERQAALLLTEKTGKDLSNIDQALETLAVFIHPEKIIRKTHVENLLGRSVQSDVYSLADALLDRNLKLAFQEVTALLRDGAKAYEVVGVLAAQIERLKKIRHLMEEGRSGQDISALLKIHPFFLEKSLRQASKANGARLAAMLHELSDCDEAMKKGWLSDRLALEYLILKN